MGRDISDFKGVPLMCTIGTIYIYIYTRDLFAVYTRSWYLYIMNYIHIYLCLTCVYIYMLMSMFCTCQCVVHVNGEILLW